MAKRNNRNIRLSDEIVEMIESQQGVNFTQKFENLVTRCKWELPNKEKELRRINELIVKQRKELDDLHKKYMCLSSTLRLASDASNDIAKYLVAQKRNL